VKTTPVERRRSPASELFRVCGIDAGLCDHTPRRFVRVGNPVLFSRVLQCRFELLAIQASFKADFFDGGICPLVLSNKPGIDQGPHELHCSLLLHPISPPVKATHENLPPSLYNSQPGQLSIKRLEFRRRDHEQGRDFIHGVTECFQVMLDCLGEC
jgi:hypothetical protein